MGGGRGAGAGGRGRGWGCVPDSVPPPQVCPLNGRVNYSFASTDEEGRRRAKEQLEKAAAEAGSKTQVELELVQLEAELAGVEAGQLQVPSAEAMGVLCLWPRTTRRSLPPRQPPPAPHARSSAPDLPASGGQLICCRGTDLRVY